jgi:hypothetical protein
MRRIQWSGITGMNGNVLRTLSLGLVGRRRRFEVACAGLQLALAQILTQRLGLAGAAGLGIRQGAGRGVGGVHPSPQSSKRARMQGEGRSSFLEKRSKKLLRPEVSRGAGHNSLETKVFCFFFPKKKAFLLALTSR